jgi:hypothetical protein
MWTLALIPLFGLHGLIHHSVLQVVAPFYQAFDTFTKHSWIGRTTSLVTQVVVLPLMAYFGHSSAYHHVLAMYLTADMIHLSVYQRNDTAVWLHHILCVIGYCVSFFVSQNTLSILVTGSLLLELTSPLIHLSWFATKLGYAQSSWFPSLAGLTILNFFIIRCVWFPYFVWYFVPKTLWVFGAVLMVLNVLWFYKLIGYALASMRKPGGSRLE